MAIRDAEVKVRAMKAMSDRMQAKLAVPGGTSELRQLQLQVSHLSEGASALYNLARARSPRVTDGEHLLRIAGAADKYARETTAAINASVRHLDAGMTASEGRIREKTKYVPDAYAAEVRATFRTLSPTQQATLLSQLVEQGRGPELAALVRVPGMLTGLNDKQRADYEAAFIAKHAPEEVEVQAGLRDAHEHVLTATDTGYKLAKSFADPTVLAEISKADTAAAAAAKAFADATMGSGA